MKCATFSAILLLLAVENGHAIRAAIRARNISSPAAVAPAASQTPQAHAALRVPEASDKDATKEKQQPGPVSMQMPESEMNGLLEKLTPRCKEQFGKAMNGTSSEWQTWGDQMKGKTSCASLNGSICEIKATMMQGKSVGEREMQSTTDVKGPSCLPDQCIAGSDLQVLASWHQLKVKELRGVDFQVQLHVDCTKHEHGSKAVAGSAPKDAEAATKPKDADAATEVSKATEADHASHSEEPHKDDKQDSHVKSSAYGLVGSSALMLPSLLSCMFA